MRHSLHIGHTWEPKHGVAATIAILLGISLVIVLAFHALAQEVAAPATPMAVAVAPEFDATSVVLQILPFLLATLSPFLTQGIRAMMKTAATSVNSKVWAGITMVLGTVIPAIAAAVGDTSIAAATAGGAAISGTSWALKQGAPVVEVVKKEG